MRGFSRFRFSVAALGAAFVFSAASVGSAAATNARPELAGSSAVAPVAAPAAAPALIGTPPTAALTVTPSGGAAPLSVVADASGSTPGTSPIGSYDFAWGDGTFGTGPQTAATASHTYTTPGTFTITVTVVDNQILLPGSSTASTTVTVAMV